MSFILLAGGEPLLRRGVIEAAGKKPSILFPIFTNGTFMTEKYFEEFDNCRNLIPIMSIEGGREATDNRRGEGVYDKLISNMDALKEKGIIFGASVTVTTENFREVSSESFINMLSEKGCKAVIFVEFVPVSENSEHLAPGDKDREYLKEEIMRLRRELLLLVSYTTSKITKRQKHLLWRLCLFFIILLIMLIIQYPKCYLNNSSPVITACNSPE